MTTRETHLRRLSRLIVAALCLLAAGCGTLTGAVVDTLDWTCPERWVQTHYDDRTETVCASTGKKLVLRSVHP